MLGCSNWSLILKRKEMPEQNYAVTTVPLPTPGDRWARWQTSRECHRFLRWGHGGPLGESWVASLPRGWNRAYSGSCAA